MTDFYHSNAVNFNGEPIKYTNATGPVLINEENKIFLHRADSTGKHQFIGGRLDDSMSPKENAIHRAKEDLGLEVELIEKVEPFHVIDKIEREGKEETLVLTHYLAKIKKGSSPNKGEFGWFSLEEIIEMDSNNEISSPNIVLASKHFMKE